MEEKFPLISLKSASCQRVLLSLNNNHTVINCLPPSPCAFTGSPKSILGLCSHLGRRNKIPQSANSLLYLKQDDSQPGLWRWHYADTHLSRCNSIRLMPEDSQHTVRLRKLRSLISGKEEKSCILLPFTVCFTHGLTLYPYNIVNESANENDICDPEAR